MDAIITAKDAASLAAEFMALRMPGIYGEDDGAVEQLVTLAQDAEKAWVSLKAEFHALVAVTYAAGLSVAHTYTEYTAYDLEILTGRVRKAEAAAQLLQ